MQKALNIELLSQFHAAAKARGINFTTEARQAGRYIWNQAWVRNGTGEENNVWVQITIDADSNSAYVYILSKNIPKYDYLNDKIKEQNLVTEFNPELYGFKTNDKQCNYAYNDVVAIRSEGTSLDWIDRVFDQVKECLKIVSNVVY